jgi:hypothetical protein
MFNASMDWSRNDVILSSSNFITSAKISFDRAIRSIFLKFCILKVLFIVVWIGNHAMVSTIRDYLRVMFGDFAKIGRAAWASPIWQNRSKHHEYY